MKYHLKWPTELQALERKFLLEIEDLEKEFIYKKHAPTFYRIIEKKIAFLKDVLNTIEADPTITLDDLAAIVDHKLETEERALKNAKNVFETDKIFDSVRILGWIKFMIIEKNGCVRSRDDDNDN
ncbi:MAG: hypothetical protein EHM25_01270 [Nitrosopumilales archaeon]|nr:MAG: hypothetical protein EHM25_01270 [Nitrosopumilales archaeon]